MESRQAALQELLPELSEHLGALAVLFHQYLKHASLSHATPVLRKKMRWCQKGTLDDMNRLAVLIVKLDGVPVGEMLELVNYAYLEPERAGRQPLPMMLGSNVYLESVHGSRLRLTLETAEELCEKRCAKTVRTLMESSGKRALMMQTLGQHYQE